jgi:hypothetical protein
MARGKRYDDETKEKALAMLATENDIDKVAKALNIPRTTLNGWKADAIINEPDFVKLRQEKKAEFINSAWEVIHLATEQVKATIETAGPGEAARVAGIYYDKQALASGDPTTTINANLNHTADLSNLTDEELKQLEQIVAKTSTA